MAILSAASLLAGACGDDASNGSPECTVDGDCEAAVCRVPQCREGVCAQTIAEPGTPCERDGEQGICSAEGTCAIANPSAVMRGLAVVADFRDRVLEDYAGDGFTSEEEIRETLDGMEEHWAWMSQGRELAQWDLIRVTLSANLAPEAFPGWPAFREAVVIEAAEVVEFADYDADGDGVLDTMFIIASSGEADYGYLIGGMARAGDAYTFVDGQGSLSVQVRAVGNFNHEVGHCRGLPDLYGAYGTLFYLTLMHDSWPVPPNGFSAFDKMRLGWMEPTLISQTTTGITLVPAEESAAALRVPGTRPYEYFLVEYRKRPEEGYGSMPDVAYDGLAVYHVLEPSHQGVDPPLVRLVAADGENAPEVAPKADDFLLPENSAMVDPFDVRGYFASDPIFRIENLARTEEGMSFAVTVFAPPTETPSTNLLSNASFEDGAGPGPDGWSTWTLRPGLAAFGWETDPVFAGTRSVSISVPSGSYDDASWRQELVGLSPGAGYLLCGWLRGEGIEVGGTGSMGAIVSAPGHASHTTLGTFDWTEHCAAFAAPGDTASVACRLGFFGSAAAGDLWCDALEVHALPSAF